jgi:hypothetical protein
MSPGLVLNNEDWPITPDPRKQKYYRLFIAKLQFAASWIRFDTSFAVSMLARFCATAGPSHWAALHHVMEYLEKLPKPQKITYRQRTRVNDGLSGFADSDWGNSSSCRSTSGNLCLYNRSPILWHSKMQKTVTAALSMAEADSMRRRLRRRRFCTFVTSSRAWASPSLPRLRCTRTTPRASSGETTSLVVESVLSTLTSGGTSLMR